VVTEIVSSEDVELVAEYADVFQVGARNMQNFRLLNAVGRSTKPVLLKRGMSATVDELLHAAEYIMSAGNPRVMLCERGIRTFGNHTRNTLDVGAIAVLKSRTHLPVIVDPSHAAGLREFVPQLAMAGIAAGADGIIVEVHPDPSVAMSDGRQSLTPQAFADMVDKLRPLAEAVGRSL
jgi:3-deoxy-7-phosphoheptulonate synthase